MFNKLKTELRSIMNRDPAAKSMAEVYFLYPGYKAVRRYRRAHWFYKRGLTFIARIISQRAKYRTGVEIHPGATIGRELFIDHGTGVVIGETSIIGDCCTIYQNVTLGGTGKDKGKRHPTVGNNVLIGAGAKVLGPIKIGDNARIAAGAVVIEDVPENATAVGVPAKIVRINGIKPSSLDQIHVGDPVSQRISMLDDRINQLSDRVTRLHASTKIETNNAEYKKEEGNSFEDI